MQRRDRRVPLLSFFCRARGRLVLRARRERRRAYRCATNRRPAGGVDRDGYRTKYLIGDDSILESRLNGEGRAVWMDSGLPDRGERELLADYARALGVAHIVEGHVPSPVVFADGVRRDRGEMFQRFGLLFLIDTGMSEGVDDSGGAVLHVTRGFGDEKAVAICPDGTKSRLWDN